MLGDINEPNFIFGVTAGMFESQLLKESQNYHLKSYLGYLARKLMNILITNYMEVTIE